MPPAGADELLGSLIGQQAELASLRELLIKRTGGNPFFIEEIVRSLAETGTLVGSRGAYTLGTAIDAVRVPSTVRTVLAERVDRLPMAEKQLLQTAAVIGVVVPLRLLQAVTGLPYEEIQRYLFDLQAAEFLFEINLFPDLEYSFKHALTREVVYGALLHDRRTALHATILRTLEKLAGDNDHIEALAYHAAQAELWEEAVRYSRQAGAKAMSRSAFPGIRGELSERVDGVDAHAQIRQTNLPRKSIFISTRATCFSCLATRKPSQSTYKRLSRWRRGWAMSSAWRACLIFLIAITVWQATRSAPSRSASGR